MPDPLHAPPSEWLLEGYVQTADSFLRIPLHVLPFTIGRAPDQHLCIEEAEVSAHHAVIRADGRALRLKDLGSTNGTYVNRERIHGEVSLRKGDVLHFASAEFRLVHTDHQFTESQTVTRSFNLDTLPQRFYPNADAFHEMLQNRRLRVLYQPIVALGAGADPRRPVAFEGLGRSTQPGIPERAGELFKMAASLDAAAELSRTLREVAVGGAAGLPGDPVVLFVNTHPAETITTTLLDSLAQLGAKAPSVQLVLEVHEGAVTDLPHMRELAAALNDYGVALAYDDFGAGQARLLELVEAPPAYLKFDRSMITGIDHATPHKLRLVHTLVSMVIDFGITPLAEGVEREEEAQVCVDLGFQLGQGWYWGRPATAAELGAPEDPG